MKGIAAIITVIVLGALMTLIGSMMVLTSISEGQATLTETKMKNNQSLLEACAEESLLKINQNNSLSSTVITTLGSCHATVNSQIGSSWDFTISAGGEMSPLALNIVLNRGSSISISTWIDQ